MPTEVTLKLEDGYFAGTSITFIKTITEYLFISVNDEYGIGKNTIILKESDVSAIKDFLRNWDDD